MTPQILETFKPFNSWPEHKIETKKFFVNGNDTGLQAIYKNQNFVKMLSQNYQVIPNEEVLKIADKVASSVKLDGHAAQPLKVDDHNWYSTSASHVITNDEKTQACAMYIFPKEYDVGGKGIKIGFVARNSIDGKWAFSASVLSFRTFCSNMMMHISHSSFLGIGTAKYRGIQNKQDLSTLEPLQVAALSAVSKRHTKGLVENDLELVKKSLDQVVAAGVKTIEKYRDLTKLKLNRELAHAIASRMPKTITKEVEWLDIEKGKISFDEKTTQWKAFNDITKHLTHKSKNFRTTLVNMQRTDQIFGTNRI